MPPRPYASRQAITLLRAFRAAGQEWRHGYELSRETGLKSGTLYPLLIRMEAGGVLESTWEDAPAAGKPPRHLYRLMPHGLAVAQENEPSRNVVLSTHRAEATS